MFKYRVSRPIVESSRPIVESSRPIVDSSRPIIEHFFNSGNPFKNYSKQNPTFHLVFKKYYIFAKDISKLIWKFSALHLTPIYKTCKVGNYFNLKCNTPALLLSNVVYRFSCPCDAGLTYIGKSTRHVVTRVKEHLNLGSSVKSKIKDHTVYIIECNLCNKKDMDNLIHRFSVIKKCSSDYDCKIHEALLIKKKFY